MVDCFALNTHQRIVAGFEIHLLGQVLEHPGRATLRVGGGDNAQRLTVGQMPGIGLGIERLVDGKSRILPVPPVQLFRQLAVGAQLVQQFAIVRL
ncbi:hypothetical protein D3C73_743120 [compost metagenome]